MRPRVNVFVTGMHHGGEGFPIFGISHPSTNDEVLNIFGVTCRNHYTLASRADENRKEKYFISMRSSLDRVLPQIDDDVL
jgi:hypothetical protein